MTKETLKAYKDLRQERDRLALMIEELEMTMYGPRSPRLDGMPHGGGENGGPIEGLAIKHDELIRLYQAKIDELTAAIKDIEAAIEPLPPRERTLIRLHYINGLTWEQVCIVMSYSWKQTHRIHSKALEMLKTEEAPE